MPICFLSKAGLNLSSMSFRFMSITVFYSYTVSPSSMMSLSICLRHFVLVCLYNLPSSSSFYASLSLSVSLVRSLSSVPPLQLHIPNSYLSDACQSSETFKYAGQYHQVISHWISDQYVTRHSHAVWSSRCSQISEPCHQTTTDKTRLGKQRLPNNGRRSI